MSKKMFELIITLMKKCQLTEEKIRQDFGLSTAEYNGLLAINANEKMLCRTFSIKMGLSTSRGSRVIDRLTRKGYLKGEAIPGDRRTLQISMTRKGRVLKRQIVEKMDECENKMLSSLSAKQRADVRGALEILAELM
jgi:DNA-binding MarR family transcriptional regulator